MELQSDLIELQCTPRTAERAYADYVTEVEARHQAEHPDDTVTRRCWRDDERAEGVRLREAVADAAVYAPVLAGEHEAGRHYKTWQALNDATGAAA